MQRVDLQSTSVDCMMLHRTCPSLAQLSLFNVESCEQGSNAQNSICSALAGFLAVHKPLQFLELRADVGAAGGTVLAGALKYNTQLKVPDE